MSTVSDFLGQHGVMLIGGVTALLSAGTLAVVMQRSPAHRQRLGETVIAATLLWVVLACIPLPRWHRQALKPTESASIAPIPAIVPADRLHETAARIDIAAQSSVDKSGVGQKYVVAEASTRAASLSPAQVSAGLYVGGAASLGAWLLLGHVLLWRMLARSEAADDCLSELFRACMNESSVRRARLRISSKPTRPLSFGILRPTVVLDDQTAASQNAGRLRQIFRHELAHLKRHDACGNALFNFAMILLYFHPLYWWLRSRTFLARELVADAQAAAASDRLAYASDLLALANSSRAPRRRAMAAVGMFIFTNNLSRRIAMLVQPRQSWQTRCSPSWCLGTLALSAATIALMSLFLGAGPAIAQTAQESQQDTKKSDRIAKEEAARLDLQKLAADQDQAMADLIARRAALQQAQAQLKATESQLQVLQKQLADAQDVKVAKSNKAGNRAASDYDVRLNENQLELDEAELDRVTVDYKRKEELHQNRAISPVDLDQAKFDVQAAALKVKRDQIELERARAETQPNQPLPGNRQLDKTSATVSGQLDLINLAESYANAVGEVRLARAKLNAARNASDPRELALAQAEAQNALGKYQMLRQIAEVATEGALSAVKTYRKGFESGAVSSSELAQVVERSRILDRILQSTPDTTTEPRK
jgi:beta-lactamase regulating signal transducer with metallopeptidase domain